MTEYSINTLEDQDKEYIWHPFTQMQEYLNEPPLIIEKGKGAYLYDIQGNKYLDGVSSLWVTVHGHRKKELDLAVKKQLGKVAHSTLLGLSNVPAIQLAKRLVDISPKGLAKVFYSDSGSEALEIGLKMAFQFWRNRGQCERNVFVTFKNAYHGDTIGSVSLGGIELFHSIYHKLLFKTEQVTAPYCSRCAFNMTYPQCRFFCMKEIESVIKTNEGRIAALVIEPMVQGAAGMILQPEGFVSELRNICNKYKILMIADEVATGFGRTGRMFACDHEGVSPDIMCVAKGLTGGYLPLAATLTTDDIYNAFLGDYDEFRTFFHGHTYTGNPLACAAAIANLDLFEKEKTLERLQSLIRLFKEGLKGFYDLSHVGDIRQIGLMAGIELIKNRECYEPYQPGERMGHKVIIEARRRGVIIRPLGNVIVLMPPFCLKESEVKKLLSVVYQSIQNVTE